MVRSLTGLSPAGEISSEGHFMNTIARFANDESGATAIEYGLIAALIAVGIIAAATALGGSLSSLFARVSTKLNAARPDCPALPAPTKRGRLRPLFLRACLPETPFRSAPRRRPQMQKASPKGGSCDLIIGALEKTRTSTSFDTRT